MRVFFEENRSFLEDQNDQVQRANETLWFWLFLALPHWPDSKLALLAESTMSIFLNDRIIIS